MERSITDNVSSPGGNAGVKSNATQAKASGLNTLGAGAQPPIIPNATNCVTKGNVEDGADPGKAFSGVGTTEGKNRGVGETLDILQGPGHDDEKKFTVYHAP